MKEVEVYYELQEEKSSAKGNRTLNITLLLFTIVLIGTLIAISRPWSEQIPSESAVGAANVLDADTESLVAADDEDTEAEVGACNWDCGIPNSRNTFGPMFNGRRNLIIGGRNADKNEYPFMVSIQLNNRHVCGGSIIGTRHVLTAAHCLVNNNGNEYSTGSLKVIAAEHNIRKSDGQMSFQVERLYFSDLGYDHKNKINDIAILMIKGHFPCNDSKIRKICLGKPGVREANINSVGAYTIGWGTTTNDNKNQRSDILQEITLTPEGHERCASMQFSFYQGFRIGRGQICGFGVQGSPTSACNGDSGGPMFMDKDRGSGNKYMQIGINSFGEEKWCGERPQWRNGRRMPTGPIVYTYVPYYLGWIKKNVRDVTVLN